MKILTEKELAEELELSPWTVRRMRLQENMPYFTVGKRIFYNLDNVCNWIKSKETQSSQNNPNTKSEYGTLRVIL